MNKKRKNGKKEKKLEIQRIDMLIEGIEDRFNLAVGIIVGFLMLTLTILILLISIIGKLNLTVFYIHW